MRLDQYLVKTNIASRSDAKKLIKKGRVCVNELRAADSALHIDELKDAVTVDGTRVIYEKFRYYMLNKPAGCVSATNDGLSSTVIDFLAGEDTRDLFPVGRLDKDTEGLLIITNDGELSHKLLSPKKHVWKEYLAVIDARLSNEDMQKFAEGLDIKDDKKTLPAKIEEYKDDGLILQGKYTDGEAAVYKVSLREGRFHQIKRMFEALGKRVLYLKRISMGGVYIDKGLKPGEFRRLSEEEMNILK